MSGRLSNSQVKAQRKAIEANMPYLCTITRLVTPATDAYGQADATPSSTWSPVTGSPFNCQFIAKARRYGAEKQNKDAAYLDSYSRLLLPVGTDVTTKDRINTITDQFGTPTSTVLYNIREVAIYSTHLALTIEVVK